MAAKGYRVKWEGDKAGEQAKEAARLAVTRLGIGVVSEALPSTPVATGTLRRSLHVAEPGADHATDFQRASGGEALHGGQSDKTIAGNAKGRVVAQVGSWLVYALIQELRRGYLLPAFDRVKRNLPGLLKQAAKETMGK